MKESVIYNITHDSFEVITLELDIFEEYHQYSVICAYTEREEKFIFLGEF